MIKQGDEGEADVSVDRSQMSSPANAKAKAKKKNGPSLRRSGTIYQKDNKKVKQAKVQTEEEIIDQQYSEFLGLCKSYKKLLRDSSQPLNYKIMELLDENLHESLYEMTQYIKDNTKIAREDDSRPGNEQVLLVKRSHIHSKIEAAMKISNRLRARILQRRKDKQALLEQGKKDVQVHFYSEGEEVKSMSDNSPNILNMLAPSNTNSRKLSYEDVSDEDNVANSPYTVPTRPESKLKGKTFKKKEFRFK